MCIKKHEVIEELLKGRLKIIQQIEGYRFSIDSVLLANFAFIKKEDNIVDLGTGYGVIPLILAYRHPGVDITGIEIDPKVAETATRSIELNNMEDRINMLAGDLKNIKKLSLPETFSAVVANPPYSKLNTGRVNPLGQKASSRHEIKGSLEDFLKAASYLLKYKGRMSLVYPARRLADLIWEMRKVGIEPKRLRTVHSREGDPAKLVLIEGVKGGGVEMDVTKPLYIYENTDSYTKEVEAMYE